MEQDAKFLDIKQKIEEAEAHLNDIREKRAAIFDDTKDGLLKMEQKSVFRYRQARRANCYNICRYRLRIIWYK